MGQQPFTPTRRQALAGLAALPLAGIRRRDRRPLPARRPRQEQSPQPAHQPRRDQPVAPVSDFDGPNFDHLTFPSSANTTITVWNPPNANGPEPLTYVTAITILGFTNSNVVPTPFPQAIQVSKIPTPAKINPPIPFFTSQIQHIFDVFESFATTYASLTAPTTGPVHWWSVLRPLRPYFLKQQESLGFDLWFTPNGAPIPAITDIYLEYFSQTTDDAAGSTI